ncbi:hypothetical protein ACMBCN_00415 [Candidatus Liberibacter asiaticus]
MGEGLRLRLWLWLWLWLWLDNLNRWLLSFLLCDPVAMKLKIGHYTGWDVGQTKYKSF